MKIEYIYHSGFTIETDEYFLIFDYYQGELQLKDKKIIVFSSHGHEDHYNPDILHWQDQYKDVSYILSSDIGLGPSDNIYVMEPYEELELDGIRIKSFASTDLGLSFMINLEGKNIFFAGDLNWWHWTGETREEQIEAEEGFMEEMAKIQEDFKGKELDLAFFPVDPRLGNTAYFLGGQYFIEKLSPKIFFPMHFGDKYGIIKKFIHKMKDSHVHIMDIQEKNQVFHIEGDK